ncbi:MAG: efflux RND transporter permease subunit [Desulfobaccales bacterium]
MPKWPLQYSFLAVQFNSLKLLSLILGCVPFCLAGMVYALYLTRLPLGATVVIGVLIVVAAMVNEGVLLLTFAEEQRQRDQLSPRDAVIGAAKIRLRPRAMISFAIIFGFIPLALNLEEGGEMLQPMAAGAIGGLTLGNPGGPVHDAVPLCNFCGKKAGADFLKHLT